MKEGPGVEDLQGHPLLYECCIAAPAIDCSPVHPSHWPTLMLPLMPPIPVCRWRRLSSLWRQWCRDPRSRWGAARHWTNYRCSGRSVYSYPVPARLPEALAAVPSEQLGQKPCARANPTNLTSSPDHPLPAGNSAAVHPTHPCTSPALPLYCLPLLAGQVPRHQGGAAGAGWG